MTVCGAMGVGEISSHNFFSKGKGRRRGRGRRSGKERELKEWERRRKGVGKRGNRRRKSRRTFKNGFGGGDGSRGSRGIQDQLHVETSQRLKFSSPRQQRLSCQHEMERNRVVGVACGGPSLCG